jgi:hypothetical protein
MMFDESNCVHQKGNTMDHLDDSAELKVFAAPPLLVTESVQDYEDFARAIFEAIPPKNIIEEIFLRDFVEHAWHIRRLRRARTAMMNISCRKAIISLLAIELCTHDEAHAETTAEKWFTCEKTKTEVANLLKKYGLDESAIVAESIKPISSDLDILSKEMALWEARRDKALSRLFKTRRNFAKRVREITQRVIDDDEEKKLNQQNAAE